MYKPLTALCHNCLLYYAKFLSYLWGVKTFLTPYVSLHANVGVMVTVVSEMLTVVLEMVPVVLVMVTVV